MSDRESNPESDALPDDGRVELITPEDVDDAVEAFDEAFPDLAGLLDAEPE